MLFTMCILFSLEPWDVHLKSELNSVLLFPRKQLLAINISLCSCHFYSVICLIVNLGIHVGKSTINIS